MAANPIGIQIKAFPNNISTTIKRRNKTSNIALQPKQRGNDTSVLTNCAPGQPNIFVVL